MCTTTLDFLTKKDIINIMKKLLISLILCLCQIVCLQAGITKSGKLSLTTGVFLTNTPSQEGWVTPWKLDLQGLWVHDNTSLSLQAESQTGIMQGPYIDGFNNNRTDFNIRKATLTQKLASQQTAMLGLGRVKANLQKSAGSQTPLPFSGALSQPPLKSSDAAVSYQKKAGSLGQKVLTVGYAQSNTANNTQPENDRLSNVFVEYAHTIAFSTLWLQTIKNQINTVYANDDYISIGCNTTTGNNLVSLGAAFSSDKLAGYDVGLTHNSEDLYHSKLGIGFAHIANEKATLEVSLYQALNSTLSVTSSYYWQKPNNGTGSSSGGIKIVYTVT